MGKTRWEQSEARTQGRRGGKTWRTGWGAGRALAYGSLAAALVLAGCGTAPGAVATAPATAVSPPLVLGVQDGSPGLVENFNPFSPNQLYAVMYMYEPLYVVSALSGSQTPWLATSYRWITPKELRFTLRKGVKWSDGSPFTAKDVVFTFNLLRRYPALDLNGVWSVLKSVSSSGNAVTFDFRTADIPYFDFIATTPIVQAAQWSRVKNPVTFTNDRPVVTGPYVLDKFRTTEVMLKKNPDYWQKSKIRVPKIEYLALQGNQTSDLMLSEGKFDMANLFTPNIQKTYVDQNPAAYHYWFPLTAPVTLRMNLAKFPFDRLRFREAMAYGINRETLYKQGEYGYEPPANQSLLAPSQQGQWLDAALQKKYPYSFNPAKAASLLSQIGLRKNAQGLLTGPGGKPLTISIEAPTGWTDWIQDCEIIKRDLGRLGITVHVLTPSVTTDMNNMATGNYDMALMYENAYSNPWFVYDQLLSSRESAPIGQPAVSNYERWINPQTDRLLRSFASTPNPALQKKILYQLETILYTKIPVLDLVYSAEWNEYQTNHYVGWPTKKNPYAMPANIYPDNLLIITRLRPAT